MLSDQDRQAVWAAWMRTNFGPVAATKPQVRAAVDAADDWVESVLAAFTAELPVSIQAGTAPTVLMANAAGIARGHGPADVSAGIVTDRNNPGPLLAAYKAGTDWLTAHAVEFLTTVAVATAGKLTQEQSFAVLESVCRRRAA